jgi:transcriptional regulator with XRE-family HTH domain
MPTERPRIRQRRRKLTPTIDPQIGANVQRLRVARDLRQEELAAHTGLTPGVISRIEHGRQGLTAERLRAIALALETTPNILLGIPEEPCPCRC